jgi:uncharacterized membrane protein YkvA (DUF1232 family)
MTIVNDDNSASTPPSIEVIEAPKFPQNVFFFKEYDGLKTFVVFLFLLSLVFFLISLIPHSHSSWWSWLPFLKSISNFASFCWHFLILTICYCLLWLTFDPHSFYGYAMGAFTVVFGLIYIVSPIDFAPDVLPIVGGLDDAAIGGLSILLGMRSWLKAGEQDKNHELVLDALHEGNQKAALKLLLQSRGVRLK